MGQHRFLIQTKKYMKNIVISIGVLGAFLSPAFAKDYKIPKENAIFSITFPEKWTVSHEDESIDAVTEDESIQLYAQTDDADTIDKSVDEAIDYLTEAGVKIDEKSQKDNEGKVNGIEIKGVNWSGTDEDGPCRVSLSFMNVGADEVITLLYWGSEAAEKKHAKELESILGSMKPLKAAKSDDKEADDKKADDDKADAKADDQDEDEADDEEEDK